MSYGAPPGPRTSPSHPGISSREHQSSSLEDFDMLEWYPQLQSCIRYFVDHAQYLGPIQALAAFINIKLPFQKFPNPILASTQQNSPPVQDSTIGSHPGGSSISAPAAPGPATFLGPRQAAAGTYPFVSLTPYIRRLVATGFDFDKILYGFFGNDWKTGIGPLHEAERRNFLFAAKSESWLVVKSKYDMDEEQMIPFLRPLQGATEIEIRNAEERWSEWLSMQDWLVGPRALEADAQIKQENP